MIAVPAVIPPPEVRPTPLAEPMLAEPIGGRSQAGPGAARGVLSQVRRQAADDLAGSLVWADQRTLSFLLEFGRDLQVAAAATPPTPAATPPVDPAENAPYVLPLPSVRRTVRAEVARVSPPPPDPEDPPPLRRGFTVPTTFVEAGLMDLPPVDFAETVCLDGEDRVR